MNATRNLLLIPSLALVLLAGCAHHSQMASYPPPPPSQQGPSAFYQHGLHDGYDAARHDVSHNDPPNFDRHRSFRNPPVPDPAIPEYRQAFREGYNNFLHQGAPSRSY